MADCVEELENRGLRKSRKRSVLAISATARRYRISTRASDRFYGNSCGPSPRSESDAPAVLRIFSHQRRRTFSTQSAKNRLMHRSKTALLFDHFVGADKQPRRQGRAECTAAFRLGAY